MPSIVNITTDEIPANSSQTYQANIVDYRLVPVTADMLNTLTLTIVDTLSGTVINNVETVNILNTGRGSIDANGVLTVQLTPGDTDMSEVPGATRVQRSLIFTYTYNFGVSGGRHQVNFYLVQLAGS